MSKRSAWTVLVVTVVTLAAALWGSNPWADPVAWSPSNTATSVPKPQPEGASVVVHPTPGYVATVNGVVITPEMIDREVNVSRLNVSAPLSPLTGDDLAAAREEALNQLIDRQLVLQAAAKQQFVLSEKEVQERVDLLFGTYTDQEIDAALAQIDATRGDLNWWVSEIFTIEAFTIEVILADALPEQRQEVYNNWFNEQRRSAQVEFVQADGQPAMYALAGELAPDFALLTPAGQTVSLADYAGQVVLINFWATWCPSCVTEMPDYEQVYQEYQPEFTVLAVNLQEGADSVQQYAAGMGLTYPVLLDSDGVVTSRQYRVTGMPGSFLIDRQGVIFYRHVGPMSADTLRRKLAELGL